MGQEALSAIVRECACYPSWLESAEDTTGVLGIVRWQTRAYADSPSALRSARPHPNPLPGGEGDVVPLPYDPGRSCSLSLEGEGWGEGDIRHTRLHDNTSIVEPNPFRIAGLVLSSSISDDRQTVFGIHSQDDCVLLKRQELVFQQAVREDGYISGEARDRSVS